MDVPGRTARSTPLRARLEQHEHVDDQYPFGGAPYVMGVSARGTFRRSAFGMD